MDKYSSDSDSKSFHRNNKKSHLRICQERSSSSDSSSSKTRRRKSKKHRRDRSRSKGTDTFSKFRNEGSRYKNSPDRSLKDRYRSKHKSFNSSFTRSRSISKDRRAKKSDRDKSDNSSSSNSCSEKNISHRLKEINADKLADVNEQIKLKLKKELLDTDSAKISADILGEINDDAFIPKQFVSTQHVGKKMTSNIVIDLKSQIIKMPDVEMTEPDSIFHPNLFTNEETRMEKWARELYVYRQKVVNNDLNI